MNSPLAAAPRSRLLVSSSILLMLVVGLVTPLPNAVAGGSVTSASPVRPAAVAVPAWTPGANAEPAVEPGRPANGTVLRRSGGSGPGELQVENGLGSDAVATLSRAGKVARAVYVRAGGTARVRDVPDGTYDLYYTTGAQWDPGAFAFRVDPAYWRFDKSAAFTTARTKRQVRYSIIEVTLHGVPGGNVTTSSVLPQDYPR